MRALKKPKQIQGSNLGACICKDLATHILNYLTYKADPNFIKTNLTDRILYNKEATRIKKRTAKAALLVYPSTNEVMP